MPEIRAARRLVGPPGESLVRRKVRRACREAELPPPAPAPTYTIPGYSPAPARNPPRPLVRATKSNVSLFSVLMTVSPDE